MQEALLTYFNGEKSAAMVILCIGIAGLVTALILAQPRFELRSFAITLGIFALIEIAIGVGLYLRTDPQVARLLAQLSSDAPGFYSTERARMVKVQSNFVMIQYIEAAIILIGTIIALLQKHRFSIAGVALAFVIHAAILLAFDIVAERRGSLYLNQLTHHPERRE